MQQGANSRQIRKYGKTLCSCLPAGTLFADLEFSRETFFKEKGFPHPSKNLFRQKETECSRNSAYPPIPFSRLKFFERGSGKTFFKKVFPGNPKGD
jgi:hypothetical protein